MVRTPYIWENFKIPQFVQNLRRLYCTKLILPCGGVALLGLLPTSYPECPECLLTKYPMYFTGALECPQYSEHPTSTPKGCKWVRDSHNRKKIVFHISEIFKVQWMRRSLWPRLDISVLTVIKVSFTKKLWNCTMMQCIQQQLKQKVQVDILLPKKERGQNPMSIYKLSHDMQTCQAARNTHHSCSHWNKQVKNMSSLWKNFRCELVTCSH